jgi:hypothetical protein
MDRYGLHLTEQVHGAIVAKIHANQTTPVERQSARISVHDVEHHDALYRVVYDRRRKVLVTFLYMSKSEWPLAGEL